MISFCPFLLYCSRHISIIVKLYDLTCLSSFEMSMIRGCRWKGNRGVGKGIHSLWLCRIIQKWSNGLRALLCITFFLSKSHTGFHQFTQTCSMSWSLFPLCSALLCSVLLCSALLYSVIYHLLVLSYGILSYFILFYPLLYCTIILCTNFLYHAL